MRTAESRGISRSSRRRLGRGASQRGRRLLLRDHIATAGLLLSVIPAGSPLSRTSTFLRSEKGDPLFSKREVGSTRPLPSDVSRNCSQPTATVFACSGAVRANSICHRLPPVATTGLHKGSIVCSQYRQHAAPRKAGLDGGR